MAKKKVVHNNDQKSVSSLQKHELAYICKTHKNEEGIKLTMDLLKIVMKRIGANGKPSRSRRRIDLGLKALGYKKVPVKK